jgi:rRNA biogenesis protein RRP5
LTCFDYYFHSDGERAHLPVAHLSDHSATAASLLPVYRTRVGSTIETAVVVSVVRGVPQLTVKPLLVAAMSSKDASEWPAVPSSVDEMRAGQLLLGTIKRAESYGVFVAFADQCIALAAKAQLSDQYVSDPTEVFTVGQTVLAVVLSIEDEKDSKRVQLTLKPSQCLPLASAALVTLFAESYFSEQDQIDERSAKKSAKSIQWSNFAFGARVKGAVDEIKDYGAILSLSQDVTGFVATAHFDKQPVVKAQVEARVLDISRAKNIVDVSMKSELLDASVPSDQTAAITDANKSAKKAKKATESLRVGDSVSVVVQLVKQDYVVLTLPRHRQAVAFAMAYGLNLRTHSHTLFAVGQEYTATVARVPSAGQRLLVSLNLVERVSQPDAKSKLVKAEKKATFHDSKITSRDQLVAGVSIQVVISAVESMYMVASVGDHTNVLARISRTEVDDARLKACGYAADREGSLDKKFTVGQKLTARVISAQFKSTPGPLFVELSLRADGDAPTALISSTRSVRQSIDWDTIKIDDAQVLACLVFISNSPSYSKISSLRFCVRHCWISTLCKSVSAFAAGWHALRAILTMRTLILPWWWPCVPTFRVACICWTLVTILKRWPRLANISKLVSKSIAWFAPSTLPSAV